MPALVSMISSRSTLHTSVVNGKVGVLRRHCVVLSAIASDCANDVVPEVEFASGRLYTRAAAPAIVFAIVESWLKDHYCNIIYHEVRPRVRVGRARRYENVGACIAQQSRQVVNDGLWRLGSIASRRVH